MNQAKKKPKRSANILIFRGIKHPYTYALPDDEHPYCIGQHVEIPLGNGIAKGLILSIEPLSDSRKLKTVIKPLEQLPVLSLDMCMLILWFKDTYRCTPYKAYQTVVGKRKVRKTPLAPTEVTVDPKYTLTSEQTNAINTILTSSPGSSFLLHGVTASGKTEIYLRVTKEMLKQNKSVLILLPEIALTPQIREVFTQRFGHQVAVIHSGLTPKKRDIEWQRIHSGEAKVIIGPRSAIFSPIETIGSIIIDECHESTYKQETHPRYTTLSVARYRSTQHGANLILGTATPTMELYHEAISTTYPLHYLQLKHRIHSYPLPKVSVVDMTEEIKKEQYGIFSKRLLSAMTERLEKKEQILLLVNRRGYAPYVHCGQCKKPHLCPDCQLSFTFHRDQVFRCHRCHTQEKVTRYCRSCGNQSLTFSGTGIQKVETELVKHFPDKQILRLDSDTSRKTGNLTNILSTFKAGADILVGTQMVAKGHHFEGITLVGVIGTDTSLNLPDFRSPERTFQLLTQVAGRAGRGNTPGEVIIQSQQPQHYAIQHALTHDFEGFYTQEIDYRKALGYPPFNHLINILFSSKDLSDLKRYVYPYTTHMKAMCKKHNIEAQFIGPQAAPIEKVHTYYRYHVLIKTAPTHLDRLKDMHESAPVPHHSIRLIPDFEPWSIL